MDSKSPRDGDDHDFATVTTAHSTVVEGILLRNNNDAFSVNDKATHDDDTSSLSDSRRVDRPSGLKRSNIDTAATSPRKRTCQTKPPSNSLNEITAEMIMQMDRNISQVEANAVLRDYNHARKIMKLNNDKTMQPLPTVAYMIGLLNEWTPKSEIICMYVRWSKRLRRDYHLDSIST